MRSSTECKPVIWNRLGFLVLVPLLALTAFASPRRCCPGTRTCQQRPPLAFSDVLEVAAQAK
jgi:hypothetical protein